MIKESKAMVSRSLRLRKDTLKALQEQADKHGLGITVYIRTVLESLVENLAAPAAIPDEDRLRYPEL